MANLQNKRSVLFLCTGNSARSQMAEALLRHKADAFFEVYSAGTSPEGIDTRTLAALEKFGLSTSALTSKSLEQFNGQSFDYVITLCDKAQQECRTYDGAKKQLAWDFPDPKSRKGLDAFATTLNELNNRLSMFVMLETDSKKVRLTDTVNTKNMSKEAITDSLSTTNTYLDPIVFYKSFTDEIRLKSLLLTNYHGELCVCELMEALQEDSQPKVSRNLAVLKKNNLLSTRKHGQWVFYRINPELPLWAKSVIAQTTENNIALIKPELQRLDAMQNRPNKTSFCN